MIGRDRAERQGLSDDAIAQLVRDRRGALRGEPRRTPGPVSTVSDSWLPLLSPAVFVFNVSEPHFDPTVKLSRLAVVEP